MTTEGKIKLALREMMQVKPLSEINTVALCEKAKVNRQTFYYHYQDIYDVIASILLRENVPDYEKASNLKDCQNALIKYAANNFAFLLSCYNSAARDLVDEFFYSHILSKAFAFLSADSSVSLSINGKRNAARRYAYFVADEFGHCFRTEGITGTLLEKKLKKFCPIALSTIYPAIIEMAKAEKQK